MFSGQQESYKFSSTTALSSAPPVACEDQRVWQAEKGKRERERAYMYQYMGLGVLDEFFRTEMRPMGKSDEFFIWVIRGPGHLIDELSSLLLLNSMPAALRRPEKKTVPDLWNTILIMR